MFKFLIYLSKRVVGSITSCFTRKRNGNRLITCNCIVCLLSLSKIFFLQYLEKNSLPKMLFLYWRLAMRGISREGSIAYSDVENLHERNRKLF